MSEECRKVASYIPTTREREKDNDSWCRVREAFEKRLAAFFAVNPQEE